MGLLDFSAQWDAIVAFLQSEDAARVTALLPFRPVVKRGQPEQWEELLESWFLDPGSGEPAQAFGILVVDILQGEQDRSRASAHNIHQTWGTSFRIYCSVKGESMTVADTNCLALVSAVCNDFSGAGGYAATARDTLFVAVVDRWSWDSSTDDLVSMAFVDVTATFYRSG